MIFPDGDDSLEESKRHLQGFGEAEVQVHAAAFYLTLLRAGFTQDADEFAEWYLETFDNDLRS